MDTNIKIRTCRICLDAKCVDFVLLGEENGWLKAFKYCFGLTITTQDEPRIICKFCADTVQRFVTFKEKCHNSHNLWKSIISDVKCCIAKQNEITQSTNIKIEDTNNKNILSTDIHLFNINNVGTDNFHSVKIKEENKIEVWAQSFEESFQDFEELLDNNNDFEEIDTNNKPNIVELTNGIRLKTKQVYTCQNCKKDYGKKKCYLKHIKLCKGKTRRKKSFDLEYSYDCGRKFNNENNMVKNEFKDNGDKPCIEANTAHTTLTQEFACGLCALNFNSFGEVCTHLNEHWSNNELECKLCDFVGVDLAAMAAHRYSHYPRKNIKFLCHICKFRHMSLLALHFHYRRDHLKKPGGFCSKCNKEYTKLRPWKKHQITHNTPKYICDICGNRYYFKHKIREHMNIHNNTNKRICYICGKFFAQAKYLKLHIETVHTKLPPVKCNHCDKVFKTEFYLKLHQKVIARDKRFKCEVCSKEFLEAYGLKSHMKSHSELRPYRCEICGASYKKKQVLKIHMNKHNGLYLHKCAVCSKAFLTISLLKRHASSHTGDRGHKCVVPQCGKSFYSKKQMLQHCALRHKDVNIEETS